MKIGFYYSLYEWFNPLWLKDRKRVRRPSTCIPQFKDVVTRYSPSIIFADGEWDMPSSDWKSEELLAWLFNESPCKDEVVVNDRWGKEIPPPPRRLLHHRVRRGDARTTAHPWEESRGMGFSYGYNRAENIDDYKTAARADPGALRPRQPRRQFPAGHRPDRRRPHPGDHAGAADRDGRLAEGQWRGDLRHPPRRPRVPVDRQANGPGRITRNSRRSTT